MKNTFSIIFYPKRTKINAQGKCLLFARLTVNGGKAEFSTQLHLKPEEWDTARKKVKGSGELARIQNDRLLNMQIRLTKLFDQLDQGEGPVTAAIIKEVYTEKKKHHFLLETFRQRITELHALTGTDEELSKGTLQHYEARFTNVGEFIRQHYGKPDVLLKDVRPVFLNDLKAWLQITKLQKLSTANNHLKTVKRIFSYATERGYILTNPLQNYRIRQKAAPSIVYLEEEELSLLANHKFASGTLARAADCFLFSCYTGLAYSELVALSAGNIRRDSSGYGYIHITRSKTEKTSGKASFVPILAPAQKILDKYQGNAICANRGRLLPVYANARMNLYLKDIAAIAGISKHLTTHTARKTFATMMSSGGVPIETVRDMLGHSSVKMTERYYLKVTEQKIIRDIAAIRDRLA